jgi:hypothetical protein
MIEPPASKPTSFQQPGKLIGLFSGDYAISASVASFRLILSQKTPEFPKAKTGRDFGEGHTPTTGARAVPASPLFAR